MQVMNTNFSSYSFLFQRKHIGKQLQLFFSTDMENMQSCVILLGNLDSI